MPTPTPDSEKLHLVLDTETLAIHPQARITEIAIVPVWPELLQNFDLKPSINFSTKIYPGDYPLVGFVQNDETVKWHTERNPTYLADLFVEGNKPIVAADYLRWYLDELKKTTGKELVIWCQGTDFDIPIITNFLKYFSHEIPWKHNNVRDLRTLAALFPFVEYWKGNHTALEDAKAGANHIRKIALNHWNDLARITGFGLAENAWASPPTGETNA